MELLGLKHLREVSNLDLQLNHLLPTQRYKLKDVQNIDPYLYQELGKARNIQNNSIIINCIDDEISGDKIVEYIDLTKYDDVLSLPCFILDLISFDNSGKALLLDSSAIDSIVCLRKSPNWCDYKDKINASISRFSKLLESLKTCNAEDKKQFISLAYSISFSEERNAFEIERIGRLKPC